MKTYKVNMDRRSCPTRFNTCTINQFEVQITYHGDATRHFKQQYDDLDTYLKQRI